ncbi:hypothetical protein [Thalassobellus suaedae]|uniref:Transporter n=1 Tax=Thalassobellus suaedae TaxID=3074124 RepID=A0ABY9XRA5_9FLAO|nr:hypothetical protein RHP51_14440 [Flavobacteriaceae bacterium HL-DH14]
MKNFILYCVFIFFIGISSYGQGKIGRTEESLKKNEKTTKSSKSSISSNNSNNNLLTELVGGFFVQIFAYTVYGIAIESPFEVEHQASNAHLSKHPYFNSKKGNYTYEWNQDTPVFRTSLSAKYIMENSRLKGSHINMDMRFLKRFGLELNYLQLWENNPNFGNDNLAIYTALAKYHRVRTEKFNAWWGLSTSYVDGAVNELGFTYGLGAELFFTKPLSLETNFNQTFINSETINKFNGLINYHIKKHKLIMGYEHLKIGSQTFSTATVGIGVFF